MAAPEAPTNVSVDGHPGAVEAQWTEPDGATRFYLQLRDPKGRGLERRSVEAQGGGTDRTERFDSLDGPADYTVRILPVNDEGEGTAVTGTGTATYRPDPEDLEIHLRGPYAPRPQEAVEGTAFLDGSTPASVVLVRAPDGTVLDVTRPDLEGEYTAAAEGPVLLEAHAFDPLWFRGVWQPNTDYERGDVVVPTSPDGDSPLLQAATNGRSGSEEPDWDIRGTTDDGEMTWASLGAIRDNAPVVNLHDAG